MKKITNSKVITAIVAVSFILWVTIILAIMWTVSILMPIVPQ